MVKLVNKNTFNLPTSNIRNWVEARIETSNQCNQLGRILTWSIDPDRSRPEQIPPYTYRNTPVLTKLKIELFSDYDGWSIIGIVCEYSEGTLDLP